MLLREKWRRFFWYYCSPSCWVLCRVKDLPGHRGQLAFPVHLAHKVKWASAAHKERLGLRVRLDGRASVDYRGSKARRDLLGLRETKDHEA